MGFALQFDSISVSASALHYHAFGSANRGVSVVDINLVARFGKSYWDGDIAPLVRGSGMRKGNSLSMRWRIRRGSRLESKPPSIARVSPPKTIRHIGRRWFAIQASTLFLLIGLAFEHHHRQQAAIQPVILRECLHFVDT